MVSFGLASLDNRFQNKVYMVDSELLVMGFALFSLCLVWVSKY